MDTFMLVFPFDHVHTYIHDSFVIEIDSLKLAHNFTYRN